MRDTIARVSATPINVPVDFDHAAVTRRVQQSACFVEVETKAGLIGHGFTAITEEEAIAAIVNEAAGPDLIGQPPNHSASPRRLASQAWIRPVCRRASASRWSASGPVARLKKETSRYAQFTGS